eukprot:GHVU01149467.1.p1 GENE.GHVU01149467.1~~GHVU01149467.1.p1  ORF type:complete len:214 (+),score=40.14 GHVU01149467.1:315-956(+)
MMCVQMQDMKACAYRLDPTSSEYPQVYLTSAGSVQVYSFENPTTMNITATASFGDPAAADETALLMDATDVEVAGSLVLVCDAETHRILVLDADSLTYRSQFGTTFQRGSAENSLLEAPVAIKCIVDSGTGSSDCYVADRDADAVVLLRLDPNTATLSFVEAYTGRGVKAFGDRSVFTNVVAPVTVDITSGLNNERLVIVAEVRRMHARAVAK